MRTHNSHALIPIAQLLAFALYLAIGYLYVISGLAVPPPFLLLLWASWVALLVIGFRNRHDLRYLLAVSIAAGILWAAMVLGLGSVLDWQA